MEVLVVIDVQPQFENSDKVIEPCRELVCQFMEEQKPIFIVEFLKFGQTFIEITKPLVSGLELGTEGPSYPKAFYVRKNKMDGSQQIWNTCALMGIQDVEKFHVCGIYRNQCVLSTVIGLAEKFPDAEIVARDEAIDQVPDSPMWEQLGPQVQLQKPKPPTPPQPSGGTGAVKHNVGLVIHRVGEWSGAK